jgi:hypothetical protein
MLKLREKRAAAILVCFWCLLLAGCGSVAQTTKLEAGFVPSGNPLVSIGEITNVSPPFPDDEKVELNPLQELRAQLKQKLQENDMLMSQGSTGTNYVLIPEIREYRPGSAFKRWLWPGYGPTILWVESVLREGDKKVGEISTRHTVEAGGAYTAGAYKSIFGAVAEDIVADLRKKLSPGQ